MGVGNVWTGLIQAWMHVVHRIQQAITEGARNGHSLVPALRRRKADMTTLSKRARNRRDKREPLPDFDQPAD